MMRALSVPLICAAMGIGSSALAVGTAAVTFGTRTAGFEIAPGAHDMTLTEISTQVTSDALLTLPTGWVPSSGIALKVGASLAFQSMRGDLGTGLEAFSGMSYGPDIKGEIGLGRFTPFLKLGYRLGRYEGEGSVNWGGDAVPAAFLYSEAVNESKDKRFASSGAHFGGGCAIEFLTPKSAGGIAAAATAEVDFGLEKMATDTRVIDGTVELEDRTDGSFDSAAVLFGGVVGF